MAQINYTRDDSAIDEFFKQGLAFINQGAYLAPVKDYDDDNFISGWTITVPKTFGTTTYHMVLRMVKYTEPESLYEYQPTLPILIKAGLNTSLKITYPAPCCSPAPQA